MFQRWLDVELHTSIQLTHYCYYTWTFNVTIGFNQIIVVWE